MVLGSNYWVDREAVAQRPICSTAASLDEAPQPLNAIGLILSSIYLATPADGRALLRGRV